MILNVHTELSLMRNVANHRKFVRVNFPCYVFFLSVVQDSHSTQLVGPISAA